MTQAPPPSVKPTQVRTQIQVANDRSVTIQSGRDINIKVNGDRASTDMRTDFEQVVEITKNFQAAIRETRNEIFEYTEKHKPTSSLKAFRYHSIIRNPSFFCIFPAAFNSCISFIAEGLGAFVRMFAMSMPAPVARPVRVEADSDSLGEQILATAPFPCPECKEKSGLLLKIDESLTCIYCESTCFYGGPIVDQGGR